jgi:hypothetical protein
MAFDLIKTNFRNFEGQHSMNGFRGRCTETYIENSGDLHDRLSVLLRKFEESGNLKFGALTKFRCRSSGHTNRFRGF